MKKTIVIAGLIISAGVNAQDAEKYAKTITENELKEHLMELASDAYEGRETGTPGQKKAEEYIVNHFKDIGIPSYDGSYTQEFSLSVKDPSRVSVVYNTTEFEFLKDFYYYPGGPDGTYTYPLFFGGYGISDAEYDEIKAEDVKGKVVLIFDGEPTNKKGISKITGTKKLSDWTNRTEKKVEYLSGLGVKGIIYANGAFENNVKRIKKFFGKKSMALDNSMDVPKDDVVPVFYCSYKMGNSLLGDNKKYKKFRKKAFRKGPITGDLANVDLVFKRNSDKAISSNVLGYIEGSDKKDELVIITAHYDHIGKGEEGINNGADDDGSGTVAALEIAEAFMQAKKDGNGPRRSVLIMTVSGEEKGLLGSRYYTENPVFPLENTVVDLNIDMIGRTDDAHDGNKNYVYLIGSDRLSMDLHELSESTNKSCCGMELDYTFNAEDDPNKFYYRSDHYNFAKNNIPVIFYFSGVHEDYHQPTDTPDKIMYDKLEKTAQLIFYTAWEIANRENRLELDQ